MVNEERCNDTRPCCLRDSLTGKCKGLQKTYEKDGECPFCKKNINDIAGRK